MKKMLPFLALIISYNLFAQSVGPSSPSTLTTAVIPGSSVTWSIPGNAAFSDDSYTTTGDITGAIGNFTDYLVATNFGFSIPGGSSITGIEVIVERADPNSRTSDYRVRIVKGGVIGATEMSAGAAYPAADAYGIYGSPTDTWGETWSDVDINAADFGIAIAAQRNALGTSDGKIDNILITVYYAAVLPVKLISFSAHKKDNAVQVKWTVEEESDMSHYEIERSSDANNFTSISTVTSRNQITRSDYTVTDSRPINGIAYYRLKSVESHGKITYSKVAVLNFNKTQAMSIYPTKIKAGTPLYITNQDNENLTVYFYAASGKLLGETRTKSNEIQTSFLANSVGMVFYKIVKENGVKAGSGTLIAD